AAIIAETEVNLAVTMETNGSSSVEAAPQIERPAIKIPEIDEAEIEREIEGTIPSSLNSFSDYKKTVNVVAGDLRQLMETATELKMQNASALVQDMMKRVEENSFSIAVVGEFKRGKSTFINALLGKDILPSDILPCSATLNRVTYGVKPGVLIKFKDGTEDQVEINKLQDYVTKLTDESEEMATKVKEAVVSYPIPYCQNNVEIIDTPGLNDDATMTDVTLSVLPHVDAAVLVIMAQSPFSEYERAFLEDKLLTSDLGRVIFIVTAIDRLNRPEDADRVVKAIKDRIRKYVIKRAAEQFGAESEEYEVYLRKIGEPRVFPISAWQALQAKEKADAALLVTSRFDVFENALERFLSEERGAIFLQVPTNRLLSASSEILSTFKIREGALQMHSSDFDSAYDKTFKQIEELRQRKDAEMKRVDETARHVEFEVKPLVGQLDEAIKATALDVIENAQISEEDVANQAAITRLAGRLNAEIQAAVQTSTQKQLEKIQLVVQRGVAAEAMRWTDFSDAMNTMSSQIEGRFGGESMEIQDTTLTQGVGIVATIFGFGGAYTGYKVAGWKGAAAGAGASIGIGVGTLIAAGLVAGTFLVLPLLIVGTLAALPAGAWISRKIFGGESVKKFRENFKLKMLENLEQQINAQSVEQKIIAEVDNAFNDLKSKIHSEVEATLNDTEKTLSELRSKRERNEILSETERQQLFKMRRETLIIKRRAEKLNDLLLQVTAV
ncbi:MAG: dynamin family protein, partial [Pyrinomonadaceae bacterium]